jgi:hypothetical protein
MIVDTHLLLSNILYKYIAKNMNFKLDRVAFAYGNIKPDFIYKEINCPHTLIESLDCVNKYSDKLMKDEISIRKFSINLGVICHFACDYFCLYHRDGNEKKGIFEHLFYELILHIKLLTLLLTGKLRINNYEIHEGSLEEIIMTVEKKYSSETKGLTRDINYTLSAATQISKLIVYSSQLYFQQSEAKIIEECILR